MSRRATRQADEWVTAGGDSPAPGNATVHPENVHRVTPSRPRRRAASSPRSILLGGVVIALMLVAGGQTAPRQSPGTSTPSTPGVVNSGEAVDSGLRLTVALDRAEVAPGDSVSIVATIENDRAQPVVLKLDECGAPAQMYAAVAVPVDPVGREWNDLLGTFKDFALLNGLREGGVPIALPRHVYATPNTCLPADREVTLAEGATASVSLRWEAEHVEGVPIGPGEYDFTVVVSHDPTGEPPQRSDPNGPIGNWIKSYSDLAISGTFRITGASPEVVSAGQALDAVLADQSFAAWLARQPASTWSTVNVLLIQTDLAEGIVPVGASWEIDLFREVGVPRNWAIGFVDPLSGQLRGVTYCDAPCGQ